MPLNSREEKFIAFVNITINSGLAYLGAIRNLGEQINEQIFDTYSLDQLEFLKTRRLLNNGDLNDYNNINHGRPSAAIGYLIDFCRAETPKT